MNRAEALELRQKRAGVIAGMAALMDNNGNFLRSENAQTYEQMDAEQKEMLTRIQRIERVSDLSTEVNATGRPPAASLGGGSDDPKVAEQRNKAHEAAFRSFLRCEPHMIPMEHRQTLQELRAQVVGTPGSGGYMVPIGFYAQMEEAMKAWGPMVQGGPGMPEIMPTATGAPLHYPMDDDTANEGEFLANETTEVGDQDIAVGEVILNAWTVTSKMVRVSESLLQDSGIPVEPWLAARLGTRVGRILNNKFTNGAGTTEPKGIVTAATLGATAVGAFTNDGVGGLYTIGSDDLVALEHSVDVAYRFNGRFMMHDTTVAHLKRLKDKQGRPLWLPGVSVGAPDTISGYAYVVNNHMDQLQTTTASPVVTRKTVLFGDLTKYKVRKVTEMSIKRIDQLYARFNQIAFIVTGRYDGNLIDAGTHPVKYLRNVA